VVEVPYLTFSGLALTGSPLNGGATLQEVPSSPLVVEGEEVVVFSLI
jgi:hypothetical protein